MLWAKAARLAVLPPPPSRPAARRGAARRTGLARATRDCRSTEACAVAAAEGVELDPAAEWAIIEALPADLTTSTARDAIAGRRTELDAIAGSVVRAGRRHGSALRCLADARAALVLAEAGSKGDRRAVALIGARSGSERVPGKNVRLLAGHPLLAYAIETARQSGVFDRIVVSTDDEAIAKVARWYGADVPALRPAEYATSTSPDIEWIAWTLPRLEEHYDLFAIVRATNPFRGPETIRRGLEQLLATPEADSIRAVELVKQHPGKMWVLDEVERLMRPLLDQSHLEVAWHAGQYQALPRRLRAEQRARDRVDARRRRRRGRARAAWSRRS